MNILGLWLGGTPTPVSDDVPLPVKDDFHSGEILPDETGDGSAKTYTFAAERHAVWVYAVDPGDLTAVGEIRVDPFGGTPTATLGIPVPYGAGFPLTIPLTSLKIYAATGIRVTVIGYSR